MNFNQHSDLEGKHAFLSASQHSWINYDEDKLVMTYSNFLAKEKGTVLHDFARRCISLNQNLPKSNKTLNLYVNDAIGYKMTPEQVLLYSKYCFGTADAISYSEKNKFLRIHDLKTGATPASMDQLEIYASLFCLEYNIRPSDIGIELRIYQFNEAHIYEPPLDDIVHIIDKIVAFDRILTELELEA